MLDKQSLQNLLEVQRYFYLPSPVLVENDWHVVRALAAITIAEAVSPGIGDVSRNPLLASSNGPGQQSKPSQSAALDLRSLRA